jgi:hypothetical protein
MATTISPYYNTSLTYATGTTTLGSISGGTVSVNGRYLTIATWKAPKTIYHLMGDKFEIESYWSELVADKLSLITTLGWVYYEELTKNGYKFEPQLQKHIDKIYKIHKRDEKISNVLS